MLAVRLSSLVQRCLYKTMQEAKYNVTVAESAPEADMRSVCVIRTTLSKYFN